MTKQKRKKEFIMRLKLLIKAIEKLLGAAGSGEENPADMYLPERLLAMAIVFMIMAIGAAVVGVVQGELGWYIAAVAMAVMSVSACLCWRNQKVFMLSDETFTYTTMFGKTIEYRFEDVVALRRNKDSYTLILKTGKVHIESMAVVSERFAQRISEEFEKQK